MILDRRTFMAIGAAGLSPYASSPAFARRLSHGPGIGAVAFDAFAVFDPRPIFRACEAAFAGRGTELADLWRARQFDYQWLRALAGTYVDFWRITESALEFAAQSLQLGLTSGQRDSLMQGYLELKAWPDVPNALAELRRAGKRLALLSNANGEILSAGVKNSGLDGVFHHIISTDRIRSFKPDPRAYQLGPDILRLHKEEIAFVASAGWDAAGAKWFGYPTFWNNRLNAVSEQLSATPDGAGTTLEELLNFLKSRLG
jgi:2-haloacid dehalogenase